MLKNILNNTLTTIAGCFAGLPVAIEGIKHGDLQTAITGFGVFFIGLLSKDAHK